MAELKNITPETVTVVVAANEAVPTTFGVESYGRRKGFVYSFDSTGNLDVAPNDGNDDWITASEAPNTMLDLSISTGPFVRLPAGGELHFVFL